MRLLKATDNNGNCKIEPATNRDILQSVIETCGQNHMNCERCPYWLKNKYNCIWQAHKIIGKDVMAYWDDEIKERAV